MLKKSPILVMFRLLVVCASLSGLTGGPGTVWAGSNQVSKDFSIAESKTGIIDPAAAGEVLQQPSISPEEAIQIATINQPENQLGVNDFRISEAGLVDEWGEAFYPDVAYNDLGEEYLVVWAGSESVPPLAYREFEIYGQFISAADGSDVGTDFRISFMGTDGNSDFRALHPAVAFN